MKAELPHPAVLMGNTVHLYAEEALKALRSYREEKASLAELTLNRLLEEGAHNSSSSVKSAVRRVKELTAQIVAHKRPTADEKMSMGINFLDGHTGEISVSIESGTEFGVNPVDYGNLPLFGLVGLYALGVSILVDESLLADENTLTFEGEGQHVSTL